jgi:hypothetical protein
MQNKSSHALNQVRNLEVLRLDKHSFLKQQLIYALNNRLHHFTKHNPAFKRQSDGVLFSAAQVRQNRIFRGIITSSLQVGGYGHQT